MKNTLCSPGPVIRWALTSISCVLLLECDFTYMEKENKLSFSVILDILLYVSSSSSSGKGNRGFCSYVYVSDCFSPSCCAHACCRVSGSWPCSTSTDRPEGGATVLSKLLLILLPCVMLFELNALQHTHTHTKAERVMQPSTASIRVWVKRLALKGAW